MKAIQLSILMLLIVVWSYDKATAHSPQRSRPIEAIFDSADSLLKISSYYSKPPNKPRINKLIKRLVEIKKEIINYQLAGNETAAWKATYKAYLRKLKMRDNAYLRALKGLGPPADSERQTVQCDSCKKWLKSYLDDHASRPAFAKTVTEQDIKDQQNFLKEVSECLKIFTSNESEYKKVSPLLRRLFIIKHLPSGIIERLIKEDHSKGLNLLTKLISSQDEYVVFRVFEAFFEIGADDPQKLLALEELLLKWPHEKGQYQYIKPLIKLLNSVRDENLLAIIFREVDKQLHIDSTQKSTIQKKEKILHLIEDNLFRGKDRRYKQAQRLEVLVQRAKSLMHDSFNINKELTILPLFRVGDITVKLPPNYYNDMNSLCCQIFSRSYKAVERDYPPSELDSLINKWRLAETGTKVSWETNMQKPSLYVARTFEYLPQNQTIVLYLRFFDGNDDLLLAAFDKTISIKNKKRTFKQQLADLYSEVAERLPEILSAYLQFEDITQTQLPNLIDIEKLKSYLYYGSYFNIHLDPTYFEERWLRPEAIFIEQFNPGQQRIDLTPLFERLRIKIGNSYPWLPILSKFAERKKILTIYGKPNKKAPQAYDIELGVNRTKTMTITLNFRSQSSEEQLTMLQIESSVRFIVEAINSYLSINHQQIQIAITDSIEKWKQITLPKIIKSREGMTITKPSLATVVPSLLLAGSSQFLVAQHKKVSWKNWRYLVGSTLMAGQLTALSGAVYYNDKAISCANNYLLANEKLRRRNSYLYTTAGTIALSAIITIIDLLSK